MWTHKKYKTQFEGRYVRANGDRIFQLDSGKKVYSFESWQMAKRLGWVKIK